MLFGPDRVWPRQGASGRRRRGGPAHASTRAVEASPVSDDSLFIFHTSTRRPSPGCRGRDVEARGFVLSRSLDIRMCAVGRASGRWFPRLLVKDRRPVWGYPGGREHGGAISRLRRTPVWGASADAYLTTGHRRGVEIALDGAFAAGRESRLEPGGVVGQQCPGRSRRPGPFHGRLR
jgi:hypothetical protein